MKGLENNNEIVGETEEEKQRKVLQLLSLEQQTSQKEERPRSVEIPVEVMSSSSRLPSGFRGSGIALANDFDQHAVEDAEYIEQLRQKQQSMMSQPNQQQKQQQPTKESPSNFIRRPAEESTDVEETSSEASGSSKTSNGTTSTSDHHDRVYDARTGTVSIQKEQPVSFPSPPPTSMQAKLSQQQQQQQQQQQKPVGSLSRQPLKVQVVRGVNVRAQPESPPPPNTTNGNLSPGSTSQQSLKNGAAPAPSEASTNAEYGVVRREYRLAKSGGSAVGLRQHPVGEGTRARTVSPPSRQVTSPVKHASSPTPPSSPKQLQFAGDINDEEMAQRLREWQGSPRLSRSSSLRDLLMGEKPTRSVANISSFQTDASPVFASITPNSVEIVFNKPTTLVCSTGDPEQARLKRLSQGSRDASPRPQSRQNPLYNASGSCKSLPAAVADSHPRQQQPQEFSPPSQRREENANDKQRSVIRVDGQAYETITGPDGRLFVVAQNEPQQQDKENQNERSKSGQRQRQDQNEPIFVETEDDQLNGDQFSPGPLSDEPIPVDVRPISTQSNGTHQHNHGVSFSYAPSQSIQYPYPQQSGFFPQTAPMGYPVSTPMGVPMGPPVMPPPIMSVGPPPPPAISQPVQSNLHPPINPTQKKIILEMDKVELRLSVRKDPAVGFGMRIAGGRGSTPFKGDDEGIFISSIAKEGPAAKAGLLVGDKLLSVSGYNLVGADHNQAVTTLKRAGKILELVVEREVFANGPDSNITTKHFPDIPGVPTAHDDSEEYEVQGETLTSHLRRDLQYGGIGISIGGGRGTNAPLTSKFTADAIYISKIHQGGPACCEGILKVGDRVLTINGIDVTDSRFDQVIGLLDSPDIKMVVYREHIVQKCKQELPHTSSSGTLKSELVAGPNNAIVPVGRPPNCKPQQWSTATSGQQLPPVNLVPTPGVFLVPMQPATGAVFVPSHAAVPQNALPGVMPPMPGQGLPQCTVNGGTMMGPPPPPPSHHHHHNQSGSSGQQYYPSGENINNYQNAGAPTYPGQDDYQGMNYGGDSYPNDQLNHQYPGRNGGMSQSYHPGSNYPNTSMNCTYPNGSNGGYRPSTPPAGGFHGHTSVPPSPAPLGQKSKSEASLLSKAPPEPYSVEEIRVIKAGGPLGISIVGGTDHACQPFGSKDAPGVFVSKISNDGPASRSNLRIGDRLLEVNGVDVRRATHNEAVAALITPVHEVRLLVRHDPQPPGLQEISLFRGPGEKLGLSIRGGVNSPSGNPYDKSDDGIFVSKVSRSVWNFKTRILKLILMIIYLFIDHGRLYLSGWSPVGWPSFN